MSNDNLYQEYGRKITKNKKNRKRGRPGGGKAQERSLRNKAKAMRKRV